MGVIHVTVSLGNDPAAWLAGIGTLLAVVVAFAGVGLQRRGLRQEREHRLKVDEKTAFLQQSEQARKVGSYLTSPSDQALQLTFINASTFAIAKVETVAIADGFPGEVDQWRGSFFAEHPTTVIDPGSTVVRELQAPSPRLLFRHEIAFTDDNGIRWHKYGPNGLQRVADDFTLLTAIQW